MIQIQSSITIARSPADVLSYLSDLRNEIHYWEGVKSVTLASGEAGKVGSRYERVFEAMGREQKATLEIVDVDWTNWRMSVQSSGTPVSVTGNAQLSGAPDGTKIDMDVKANVKWFLKPMAGRIRNMMAQNVPASLARLKTVLEAEAPKAATAKPKAKKAKA